MPATAKRRPRRRTGEGGRRLHSAGSAIAVSLGALAVALLLNAPGLHKSATTQPEGWKRDVALAVTGPLQGVSGALLLDQPRRALKAALGRSEDDRIDTAVAAPQSPKPTTPAATPTTPPTRVKFTPQRKLRLWIAGDSLVVVPGESVLREVAGNRAVDARDAIDGRIATGLERPDVFNWFTHVREVMQKQKPHAVVLMFGGNDDHGFMTGIPEGREVGTFGSPTWRAEYRRRVAAIMDTVTGRGGYLVWIGLPISRDAEQTLRYDVINAIVQTEAAKRKGRVAYLDTYFFFAGDDGGYAQYVEDSTGKLVKMRADDGVHFERSAGDIIADKVVERLAERYDFTSWRGAS
ncbi:MAG TPA: DUF459 domain-containing protein [Gaiellaceae bacterium]|nr:DUF459 domain-containing protein [Gaiellaceae bacterium]